MESIAQLRLTSPSTLEVGGITYACTSGRGGIARDGEKREGDLKTPSGSFALRRCYYRADRMETPKTALELTALTPDCGWCDDATHPRYNQFVTLPFAGRHETLWRTDPVYDLIIPLGYNDGPIVPRAGSAIFLHLMRDDGAGTEGCIGLKRADLLALLPGLSTTTTLVIS